MQTMKRLGWVCRTLWMHARKEITTNTYLLKLDLIHDDEAASVGWPMDDGTIIQAFSIQHYSELMVHIMAMRRKEQKNIRFGWGDAAYGDVFRMLLPFAKIALWIQLVLASFCSVELEEQPLMLLRQMMAIQVEMPFDLPPLFPLWMWMIFSAVALCIQLFVSFWVVIPQLGFALAGP